MNQVKELSKCNDIDGPMWLNVLNVFAFGAYNDLYGRNASADVIRFVNDNASFMNADVVKTKLKKITIARVCSKASYGSISYESIMSEVAANSYQELEDLVISCIYSDLLNAKLNQRDKRIDNIQSTYGKDIQGLAGIDELIGKLDNWLEKAENVQREINNCSEFLTYATHADVENRKNIRKIFTSLRSSTNSESQSGSFSSNKRSISSFVSAFFEEANKSQKKSAPSI